MEDALPWLDDVPLVPDAILDVGNEAWVVMDRLTLFLDCCRL